MKLLVVSQYFWPETFLINNVVRTLAERGHDVVVATGKPNYPDGKVFEGYAATGTQHERYLGKIDVFRVPLWPRGRGGGLNLALNYVSFVLSGLVCFPWLLRGRDFDAILVFAPSPITQTIPAVLLKWLKKARLILWIQDLWPESLQATGFVKSRALLTLVRSMVRVIYRRCDTLLVQSRAFIDHVGRDVPHEKIIYFPNCCEASAAAIQPAPPNLAKLLDDYFCVVFAGNLGAAQALETVVQAAIELKNHNDIRIVLIGSGSRLEWLREQKSSHDLHNLILAGRFPVDTMPHIFARASALLVSLGDEPILARTVPSKVQAYMSAGRPIVASMNGEGARLVEDADAGFTSPSGDHQALVRNILRLRDLPTLVREQMGISAKRYFEHEFEMQSQITKLTRILDGKGSV